MFFISGEISSDTAEKVIRELEAGTLKDIYICSQGGDLAAAFAIYDALKGKGIRTIGTGTVQSAGLVILLAGDTRLATERTRFLTHAVKIEGEISESDKKEIEAYTSMLVGVLTEPGVLTEDQARGLLNGVHTFGVDEALGCGFIGEVQ